MFPKEHSLFGALLTSSSILCSDLYNNNDNSNNNNNNNNNNDNKDNINNNNKNNSSIVESSRYSQTETVQLICPEHFALTGFENRHVVCSDGQPELSNCIVCRSPMAVEVTVCVNSCDEISSPVNFNSLIYNHHKCKNGSFFGLLDEKVVCLTSLLQENRFFCGFEMTKDENLPFNKKELAQAYSSIFCKFRKKNLKNLILGFK